MAKLPFIFGNGKMSTAFLVRRFGILFLFAVFSTLCVSAQQIEVKGAILDEGSRVPIIGATLKLKGQQGGTVTDVKGNFSLKLRKLPVTLLVSAIGYKYQEIDVYEAEPTIIYLAEDYNKLNEVVVVGYTTQKKQDFTGSASRISSEEFKNAPIQSFDQALSGKASGVNISIPNGVLNNAPVIRIRGVNSISLSSYPLVVVDGIPINTGDVSSSTSVANNPLADINPADIESIDVLKDAASTSIYGSRAAAGVLLITTKKGKAGKTKVNYDFSIGFTNAVRLPKLLNSQHYMDIKNESVLNSKNLTGNANNTSVASQLFFPSSNADGSDLNTNWYDYVYRTGVSQNHGLSVSGGNKTTSYYLSANYSDQKGFLVGNDFKRKGVRFNLEHEVNSWLKLKGNLSYTNSFNEAQNSGSLKNSTFLLIGAARLALILPPNVAAYNADGSYNVTAAGKMGNGNNKVVSSFYNPLALFDYSRYTSENDRIIGSLGATIKLHKDLELSTTYSIDRLKTENISFLSSALGSSAYSSAGSATNVSALRDNWDWSSILNYKRDFGSHHLSALAGYEVQKFYNSIWGATATNATDVFFENYQGGWGLVSSSNNYLSEKVYVSYFSRLNYDFNSRYLLTINVRRDGNSALAAGKKFGNFGGVSGGWNLSEEDFYKSSPISRLISTVKLRSSWGKVGNGNLPSDYGSLNLYNSSLYGNVASWSIGQAGNTDLAWETSEQTNFGVDFEFWKKRVQAEVTYFNNNINGLILESPQSPSKGIPGNTILANVGSMYNRGIEIGLNAKLISKKNFTWTASFNYTHVKNEVTALAGGNADIISYTHTSAETDNITRVGYPVGSLYGAKTAGVNPENGRRIFINAKGEKVQYSAAVAAGESNWTYLDGTKAPAISTSDYQIIGNATPTWYGGFGNNFRYKNFDLSLNFTYSGGNLVMNGTRGTLLDQRFYNNSTEILNRWTTVGQVTTIPRLVYNDQISNGSSFPISENAENADFLRLQTIALGYTLPGSLLKRQGISSIRLSAQVNNAFLLTNYSGTDPESSVNGNSNTTPGIEKNSVGQGRTFTFGLNVGF